MEEMRLKMGVLMRKTECREQTMRLVRKRKGGVEELELLLDSGATVCTSRASVTDPQAHPRALHRQCWPQSTLLA